MRRLELNRAQRALWYAQALLGDDVPLSIAQCLEIDGPLDVPALRAVIDDVATELDVSPVRVVDGDGHPHLVIEPAAPSIVDELSLRHESDPAAAAESWMATETAGPLPIDGPLIRCVVLDLGADRRILYARAHHILLDGYAAGLLIRHAAHRYRLTVAGTSVPAGSVEAPPAPRPIDTILDHEARYRGSTREQLDRDHWRTAMIDDIEPLVIGDTRAGSTVHRHVVGTDIDDAMLADLHVVAARTGVPTIAVLIAAAALILGRLRERDRVPLTLVTSARINAPLRAAAGTMSNLLPIIVGGNPDLGVDEHLRSVAATMSGALRHQQYRYEEILADAGRGGHGDDLPARLGPVLNILPAPPPIEFGGGLDTTFRVLSTGPVTDLNVNVYPGRIDGLRVEIETNPAAHPPGTSAAVLDGVLAGLGAFLRADPTLAVSALPLPAGPIPGSVAAVGQSLRLDDVYRSHRASSRPAVIDGDTTLTSRELADRAAGLAVVLRRRARSGDVIAVECRGSVHTVVAAWAVAAAEMCILPVDPALPEARRRAMLDDAAPSLTLTEADLTAITPADVAAVAYSTTPTTAAYLLYTSGTTGTPKGITVSHTGIAGLAETIDTAYGLGRDSVVAHLASPGFDTAIVEMLAAARAGATLVVVPDGVRGGGELGEFLTAARVTHLFVTPAVLATIPVSSAPTVTHLVVGGDVCPAPLMRTWAARAVVRCAYGPTETTCSVTLTAPIAADDQASAVPLGAAMPGVRLSIRDHRLRPVPAGGDGELYVAGPSVARGIRNRAGLTASRFVACPEAPGERMYRTGDRVRLGTVGCLFFLGRVDDQVKVNGVRVEPADVDRAALDTGLVSAAVTVARRGERGARLHLYAVPAAETDVDDLPRRLRAALAQALPAAFVPSTVTVLDELPLTVNRKVDRAKLPAPRVAPATAYAPPRTETETAVVLAFQSALGADRIGLDDDFFDLGGDSLIATAVASSLTASGRTVAVRDVFTAAPPRRLAALARTVAPPDANQAVPDYGVPIPLAPPQRDVFDRRYAIDHLIAFTVSLPTVVDSDTVGAAAEQLLHRHEMLRSVTTDDGCFVVDAVPDPHKWSVDRVDASSTGWARDYLHRGLDVAQRYPLRIGVAAHRDRTDVAIAVHHLAADGASLSLLLAGLLGVGRDERHPYRAYARAATLRAEQCRNADIAHVRATVDPDRCLMLPIARPRPARWRSDGARVRADLPRRCWTGLTAADTHRVPVLTVLRSSLATMLARESGTHGICIGALVSGRDDGAYVDTVGMFVNTVAVPCRVAERFADTVVAVRRAEDEAFGHASTPFTTVVQELAAARTGTRCSK